MEAEEHTILYGLTELILTPKEILQINRELQPILESGTLEAGHWYHIILSRNPDGTMVLDVGE